MNDKQSESNNHHDFTTCSASISHVAYATISQLSDYDLLVANNYLHLIFMLHSLHFQLRKPVTIAVRAENYAAAKMLLDARGGPVSISM